MGIVETLIVTTALAGVGGTGLGGLIGAVLQKDSKRTVSLLLSFASGVMLSVVFGEILPQSILMYTSKLPAFSAIVGILVGLLIIF